tara:strand:+ start:8646 stop:9545 length:900 start_codon:yes stop_codon:yes gene_type:complete
MADCNSMVKITQQVNELNAAILIFKMRNAQSRQTSGLEWKMGKDSRHCSAALLQELETVSGFLIDWDGCCALDNRLLGGAARFLKQNRRRSVIVSNNSTETPSEFRDILLQNGVDMPEEQIVLAGKLAIDRALELAPGGVSILGSHAMRVHAETSGLQLVDEGADIVVLLRDTSFSYERLERACNDIAKGARLIVANPDMTHPGENGRIKPETGALLAALLACVGGDDAAFEMIGKPSADIFQRGLDILSECASQAIMIGDNPVTDIAGAEAIGMRGLLVKGDPDRFLDRLCDQLEALD